MPIYEFRCDGCGHQFELLTMRSDDLVEPKCPECQSPQISRLMSAGSAVVSGSSSSAGPTVQSNDCGSKGSCASITLPGHTR